MDSSNAAAVGAWDAEADLVVVGSGAAGLAGAIAAADAGADVIVLEKASVIGGTTAMSGGAAWVPCNDHMADVGLTDSREEALGYLRDCAGETTDDELLVAFVDHAAEMLRFLEGAGVRPPRPAPAAGGALDYRPWLDGAKPGGRNTFPGKFPLSELGDWAAKLRIGHPWQGDRIEYYTKRMHLAPPVPPEQRQDVADPPPGGWTHHDLEFVGSGTALVGELLKCALAHGVQVVVDAPGRELIVEGGRVVGVEAEREGVPWRVRARAGVLMATGGFTANEDLKRQWLSRPLHQTCDVDENQGDGHLMGMAAGAQVANLGDAWWMPFIHIGETGDGMVTAAYSREDRILPHTMIVNRRGSRFVDEATNYNDFGEAFGLKSGAAERNFPAWLIFDQQGVERYAGLAYKVPAGPTPAWLIKADTIEDLARQAGIDAAGLQRTVERFNGFAEAGVDLDFRRGENPWDVAWGDPEHGPNPSLGTIARGPYFAVEVVPGALATKGGLRVDGGGRVLSAARPFGPVPGLYAAGNCSNAAAAGTYAGPGFTIGVAMTFAYIAARLAVREAAGRVPATHA